MNLPFLLQKFSKTVHHHVLMIHEAVNITIKRDGGIFMTKYLRQRFNVHAAFKGASRKCVSQSMKPPVRDLQLF